MENIIDNYKDVDFKKSALTFFMPDGRVICINKIEGLQLHPEYLKLLNKRYPELETLVDEFVLDYYIKNPMMIMIYLWPLYLKEGISIYLNLSSYITEETEEGILLFSEELTKETRNTISKMDSQLEKIYIFEIGRYFKELGTYEYIPFDEISHKNSQEIFKIIDNKEIKLLIKY